MIVIASECERQLANKYYPGEDVLVTGVGATNVIKALKDVDKATKIKNIGYAGSNNISIGTVVTIGSCEIYRENTDYVTDCYKLPGKCKCYTSNDFVTHTSIHDDCVFDMELAIICALGFNDVESIKVVSDNLNYKEYEEKVK